MASQKHHATIGSILSSLVCGAAFCLLLSGNVYGGESCITCHTDEDLLEENLAEVKTKTSAMQAGSG